MHDLGDPNSWAIGIMTTLMQLWPCSCFFLLYATGTKGSWTSLCWPVLHNWCYNCTCRSHWRSLLPLEDIEVWIPCQPKRGHQVSWMEGKKRKYYYLDKSPKVAVHRRGCYCTTSLMRRWWRYADCNVCAIFLCGCILRDTHVAVRDSQIACMWNHACWLDRWHDLTVVSAFYACLCNCGWRTAERQVTYTTYLAIFWGLYLRTRKPQSNGNEIAEVPNPITLHYCGWEIRAWRCCAFLCYGYSFYVLEHAARRELVILK